jgi:lipoprotein-anchoring transpeptidase ErfK/SrfK
MPPRSLMSSLALAAVVATTTLVAAPQAQAQGLLDFLWGGGQEWGGGKQTVSFDPKFTAGQIIVSFGDRRLYLITKAGQATSYPIAVPREQSRWQGATSVTDKRVNPSWRPTPDMLRENPKLPLWVPGGHRMNPLGVRAMYLGSSLYRIHGTDAPWTIGQAVSKGCIRMLNEDVLDLYPRVPVGTKVTVTWQRFNSQMIAGDDEPAPFSPTATASTASYKTPGASVRPIRQRTPSSDAEQVVHNDAAAVIDPEADEATLAAAAEKPIDPKPVKKAEVHKKHEATATAATTSAPHDAVAIAEKAAAAAAKAAEAARAAADAAKKAAEDAKKATSAESKEPGKSAAL